MLPLMMGINSQALLLNRGARQVVPPSALHPLAKVEPDPVKMALGKMHIDELCCALLLVEIAWAAVAVVAAAYQT